MKPQKWFFRYGASEKGVGIIILILFVNFIVVKITSPTLPVPSTNRVQRCVTSWLGEIFCMIFICFLIIGIQFFDPQEYVIPFLFDSVLRVGFPAYYIYSFPPLYDYVSTSFKKNVVKPLKGRKENVRKLLSGLTRSPQIDITVWISNYDLCPFFETINLMKLTFKEINKYLTWYYWNKIRVLMMLYAHFETILTILFFLQFMTYVQVRSSDLYRKVDFLIKINLAGLGTNIIISKQLMKDIHANRHGMDYTFGHS